MSNKIRPNPNSQYDPGLVLKDVHDFDGQALRTVDAKSLISGSYSHFLVAYNSDNNPTNVKYLKGLQPRVTEIECFSDFNGNLNNKYLVVYSNPEKQKYHIWFSVDNLGVDPAPANSIGIKVDISENDPAIVVATAMTLVINSLYKNIFTASKAGVKVSLMTVGYGIGLNSSDFNTAFGIVNFDGEEELVSDIIITYDSAGNPIYNGQVLKDYYYDIYSGKFERSAAVDIQNLSVNVDLDGFSSTSPDSVQVVGSIDGSSTGQKYGLVNNIRQQILASHDREQNIVYEDFGTKNQRITEISYTSNTFPGITLKKIITYTLVGNLYRRDSINWVTV